MREFGIVSSRVMRGLPCVCANRLNREGLFSRAWSLSRAKGRSFLQFCFNSSHFFESIFYGPIFPFNFSWGFKASKGFWISRGFGRGSYLLDNGRDTFGGHCLAVCGGGQHKAENDLREEWVNIVSFVVGKVLPFPGKVSTNTRKCLCLLLGGM